MITSIEVIPKSPFNLINVICRTTDGDYVIILEQNAKNPQMPYKLDTYNYGYPGWSLDGTLSTTDITSDMFVDGIGSAPTQETILRLIKQFKIQNL